LDRRAVTDVKLWESTPSPPCDLFFDLPGTPLTFQAAIGLPFYSLFPLTQEQISCQRKDRVFCSESDHYRFVIARV